MMKNKDLAGCYEPNFNRSTEKGFRNVQTVASCRPSFCRRFAAPKTRVGRGELRIAVYMRKP